AVGSTATGIGLANTTERLKRLHGSDHDFVLRWPDSGGCQVTIELLFKKICGRERHARGGYEETAVGRVFLRLKVAWHVGRDCGQGALSSEVERRPDEGYSKWFVTGTPRTSVQNRGRGLCGPELAKGIRMNW